MSEIMPIERYPQAQLQQLQQQALPEQKEVGDLGQIDLSGSGFSTMGQMQERYPKVYKAIMEGMVQSTLGQMRKHDERMRQIQREGRRNGG